MDFTPRCRGCHETPVPPMLRAMWSGCPNLGPASQMRPISAVGPLRDIRGVIAIWLLSERSGHQRAVLRNRICEYALRAPRRQSCSDAGDDRHRDADQHHVLERALPDHRQVAMMNRIVSKRGPARLQRESLSRPPIRRFTLSHFLRRTAAHFAGKCSRIIGAATRARPSGIRHDQARLRRWPEAAIRRRSAAPPRISEGRAP